VELSTLFLLCGTLVAHLPYDKVTQVREKNRRLGLGLMGVHEWFIQRGKKYGEDEEFKSWLGVYRGISDWASKHYSQRVSISTPVANRAIAPTGTIGMLAGTTTGIEPIYAVAYKRRYLTGGNRWKYQYHVDHIAQEMIETYGTNPEEIESASDLANDLERRLSFQSLVQRYVDMGISSTVNLPAYREGETNIEETTNLIAKYAQGLRGLTFYPDGARGGQPLNKVSYHEAKEKLGEEFEEGTEFNDVCTISGRGGFCGS